MPNDEQRENWNTTSGAEWVRLEANFDGMLQPWVEVIMAGAAIEAGEQVLDVGCGTGATTLAAAYRTGETGRAVGVDLSAPMIARARERADSADLTNVEFHAGDGQVDDLTTGAYRYDVAISRFGVMFFDDPVAAFTNIGKAMQLEGRLAVAVWSPMAEQGWLAPMVPALEHLPAPDLGGDGPGMFALADPDRTSGILQQAGWRDIQFERQERSVLFGGGGTVEEAVDFLLATGIGRALVEGAAPDAVERGLTAVREVLEQNMTPDGAAFSATAWLITADR